MGLIPGSGRAPEEENGNPTQYSYLRNPMDRGAWQGYSPQGNKELDTTELLHFPVKCGNLKLARWEEGTLEVHGKVYTHGNFAVRLIRHVLSMYCGETAVFGTFCKDTGMDQISLLSRNSKHSWRVWLVNILKNMYMHICVCMCTKYKSLIL